MAKHKTEHKTKHKKTFWEKSEKYIIAVLIIALIGAIGYAVINLDRFIVPEAPQSREIAAEVNGEPIYQDDVQKRYMYLQAQLGPTVTETFALNHSINQELLLQEAGKLGITVDMDKIIEGVDSWLAQVEAQVGKDQVANVLLSRNISYDQFRNDTIQMYYEDFIVFTLFNNTIFSQINESQYVNSTVTEEEARAYFDANPEEFDTVDASHILVCYNGTPSCTSNRTKAEALARAQETMEMLKDNGNFEEIAQEYSDGPSSADGGNLGEFSRGMMVPEFEEAAFALKYPNQLSDIVESDFGYHIIKLNGKRSGYDEFHDQIMMQLQLNKQQEGLVKVREVQEQLLSQLIQQLRDQADIRYMAANPDLSKGIEPEPGVMTFSVREGDICTEDGKPIIRMYSTTTCPHCQWVKDTFDTTMKELMAEGKIVAYHWELDINDNTLTSEKEAAVPPEEFDIYRDFNPRGTVPTFVFGCKYYRVGNGYESEGNLEMEKREFLEIIDKLTQ